MADAYWRYTSGGQQQAAPAPAAALAPFVAKRPRSEYDAPSGPEYPGYYGRDAERGMPRVGRDADPIEASYERYLRSGQISSHVASESARSMHSGISGHPIDDPRVMGIGGSDPLAFKSRKVGMVGGRPEATLPPDASNLFRPFLGYKEVRLVPKGSRHAGGDPLILCFVDFVSPLHAATAMDALQVYLLTSANCGSTSSLFVVGAIDKKLHVFFRADDMGYKFDEHERDSVSLKLQFSRNPGARCSVELLNIIHEDFAMIGDSHWHGKNCDPTNGVLSECGLLG
ncbi:hypothetical protein RDI58_015322 [Solanum bulbocastanum]|uniref:Uncharacterized protein n=1 Tax=Solanum bulbocastanum TaxID=147425 RepID=A0AAN8TKB5_SOLBU